MVCQWLSQRLSAEQNYRCQSAAGTFPLRFGNDSFVQHLAAAKATGKPCVVLSLAGIGLDIDTSEDLRQLQLAPGNKRSQLLARSFGALEAGVGSLRAIENDRIAAKT